MHIFIGNYGNKLDENVPAQASTTPPSNPVYDGNAYYYLPWTQQKPCVVIDSQWEDVSYRIASQNILIHIAGKLVRGEKEGEREGEGGKENNLGIKMKFFKPAIILTNTCKLISLKLLQLLGSCSGGG